MEYANLNPHHKLQDQCVKNSSLETQTTGHQVSTTDEWNPSLFSNMGLKYNRNLTETIPKSRDSWPPPLIRPSMNQDHSFNQQSAASEFLLANMKDEMSDSFPKLSEMLYCHSNNAEDSYLVPSKKHNPQSTHDHHLGANLWHHSNFPMSNHMTDLQLSSGDQFYTNSHHIPYFGAATSRNDFNHIFPSTNISKSDFCSTLFSSSLDLNLKALDLLTSTYDGGNCNQSLLDNNPGKLSRSFLMSHDQIRERSDSPSTSSKISTLVGGSITSTKRPGSFSETKESIKDANKKHRSSMSRSPCPTLKVRKEKLGDRIAALQKMVAPFGKTDTASVLTEAIGYIQFLHDQIQTLSVPYMKSTQSKLYRSVQMGIKDEEAGKEEQIRDLKSRGLCLVPQSYASYYINSCSGGI